MGIDAMRPDATGIDALTMDGRIVRVRTVRPTDGVAIRDLYERASARSRYLRFFGGGAAIDAEVDRLVRPEDAGHMALLVEQDARVVAVASYERIDGETAEFAVFVDDARHGQGIGTLALEHLAAAARRAGIVELVGDVLPVNRRMLRVSADLAPGIPPAYGADPQVVRVRVPARPGEAALDAVGSRDRTAEHRSLRPMLAPASVAVVGAGRRPGSIGHEVLRALVDGGFVGPVYPVNPHATEIAGRVAFPSVAAIGRPVDLAVIAVPAVAVEAAMADCAASGVRAAVVLTSGLGEVGADGAAVQAAMVRLARAHGLRVAGPNCLGVINTDPDVRLVATFAPSIPPAGGLAVASQSGAVGVAILEHAARAGLGVSTFVSLGNKADVSGNDLLAYWYDDPATRAVALYLESFGNPRRFAWVARALARRKPVLAVKSGRSSSGARAGLSHTAAAATSDTTVDTLFAQAGVIRTDTLGELLDAARVLVDQPLPRGNRLAVIGNAGGLNILAADAAEAAGLTVPELSPAVQAQVRAGAPWAASVANPVDLGAEAGPDALAATVKALAGSGGDLGGREVDALVATFVATRTNDVTAALAALAGAAAQAPELPVAAVVIGAGDAPAALGSRRVPVYQLPEDAVRALGHAAGYAAWLSQPLGSRPSLPDVDPAAARAIVAAATPGWQPPAVAQDLLSRYGIPIVATRIAVGVLAAVEAAEELGYPVAVKAADEQLVHKSDVGAVKLGLPDADAVRAAYRSIADATATSAPAVVVQPMARPGVELVAGIVHDALFGSLVMVGLGGVYTDVLGDRAFRLLPVTDVDAASMWRSLRAARLLTGYRGGPAVDTNAVENLLLRLGRLAEDLPEVAELDLNPVLASPDGVVAVDVKLRLAPVSGEPDPYLRGLREPT
jgi:acyl-CoA synthetase (NDP forming)/GNAT superfamily N-acetyltransferase